MDPNVDQFYVGLMSNESMNDYPDNVLSAFTNKLARPIQIDESWCVGLTHISYGPHSTFQRMEMAPETSIDLGVETFEPVTVATTSPVPPKKRRHRDREYRTQKQEAVFEKIIAIKVSDTQNIVLTQSDLKELTYDKHHLNGGKLLKILPEKIQPKLDESDAKIYYEQEMLKRKIKHQIFDLIQNEDWTLKDITKYKRHADEFMVHVYQGTKKSSNCILKYREYPNIEQFIREIVYQLPVENGKKNHYLYCSIYFTPAMI